MTNPLNVIVLTGTKYIRRDDELHTDLLLVYTNVIYFTHSHFRAPAYYRSNLGKT